MLIELESRQRKLVDRPKPIGVPVQALRVGLSVPLRARFKGPFLLFFWGCSGWGKLYGV